LATRGYDLSSGEEARTRPRTVGLQAFEALVIAPTLTLIAVSLVRSDTALAGNAPVELAVWVLIIGLVELIPVPMWRGTHISMGFPLLMVVAFLYEPPAAALAALLAASDPRELKHEVGFLRALFNRCQVALSVFAASAVFHALVDIQDSQVAGLFLAAALASVVDYLVNATFVCFAASIYYRMPPLRVIRQLKVGRLSEFVISYLGLAVFGLILAKFFIIEGVGFWSVPIFVLPVLLARQMFFRSKALEEAHKELQDREQVLRALSNRMAEERQDERGQIAAYLHDDLAQLLFKLSLQVDIARRHLASGKLPETEKTLEEIKDTKSKTSDRIRALIRDLHRSPLGPAGLAEALQSFIIETGRDADIQFHTDIAEVELPPPIALLLYHIGREGVMNALKHAHPSNVWLTVRQDGDAIELRLRDDGTGFDSDAPAPEGHYGLTMMRERALVGGGTFDLQSAPDKGTSIVVRFPTSSWLRREGPEAEESHPTPAKGPTGVSPGSARIPTGEQGPASVPASLTRSAM
jgi:signal transduction histidine kinase